MNYEGRIKKYERTCGIQHGAVRSLRPASCFAPFPLGGFAFNSSTKTTTSVAPRRSLSQRSAFQKGRVKEGRKISDHPKNFGNISEKRPFSEKISDLFFWEGASFGSNPVKVDQTECSWSNFKAKCMQMTFNE